MHQSVTIKLLLGNGLRTQRCKAIGIDAEEEEEEEEEEELRQIAVS
jgi:hypothetical protein